MNDTTHVPSKNSVQVSYLPKDTLLKSMREYSRNHLHQFLVSLFQVDVARELSDTYYLGTSRRWSGANIFWQVDLEGRPRQAKLVLYNAVTGRRSREAEYQPFLAGGMILRNRSANLQQCFFGEHLLTLYPRKPVAIVESEKTAMVASAYFPERIWLATGGSNGCRWTSPEVCRVLERRDVMLWPDPGNFESWQGKAEIVRGLISCRLQVSNLLEQHATRSERAAGWDVADYLLQNRQGNGLALNAAGIPVINDRKSELAI